MKKRLVSLSLILSFGLCLNVFANPQIQGEAQYYKQVQKSMDKDIYQIYRISERVIRANKLYDYPWRIEVPSGEDYAINAYTKAGNLIVLNNSIPITFLEDPSALAYIIAHEMAHQSQKHLGNYNKQAKFVQKEIEEKQALLNKHIEQHNRKSQKGSIFGITLPRFIGRDNSTKLEKQTDDLKAYVEQKNADLLALNRKIEYEADRIAVLYVIKAGFDPQAAIKALEFMQRVGSSTGDDKQDTHPETKKRIWQINTVIKNTDINKLKQEGFKNLKQLQPLQYHCSKNCQHGIKKNINIYTPQHSKSPNKHFEELFGY